MYAMPHDRPSLFNICCFFFGLTPKDKNEWKIPKCQSRKFSISCKNSFVKCIFYLRNVIYPVNGDNIHILKQCSQMERRKIQFKRFGLFLSFFFSVSRQKYCPAMQRNKKVKFKNSYKNVKRDQFIIVCLLGSQWECAQLTNF